MRGSSQATLVDIDRRARPLEAELSILLVENKPDVARPIEQLLTHEGYRVCRVDNGADAMVRLKVSTYDLVVADLRLLLLERPGILAWLRAKAPQTSVVAMSAGTIPESMCAPEQHIVHYPATKPFEPWPLLGTIQHLATQHVVANAFKARSGCRATSEIIGTSPAIVTLKHRVAAFANSDVPVLIQGESGTGKELVAKALHAQSPRRHGPFVAINCAAFPETLFEAELFGHERGAFTGAIRKRDGRFRAAHGGTLFLDEIFEMALASQAKLLRVLQENVVQPLGSNASIAVDVRIVSATNSDLRGGVAQGRFREDLYYRLKVLELRLPPLRERRTDMPLLVGHLLSKFAKPPGNVPRVSARAWAALMEHPFPGNVRELEHTLQHALVLSRSGEIDIEHLPDELSGRISPPAEGDEMPNLGAALAAYEREYILRVLERAAWSKTAAARLLGISRKSLWQRMKRLSIPLTDETTRLGCSSTH